MILIIFLGTALIYIYREKMAGVIETIYYDKNKQSYSITDFSGNFRTYLIHQRSKLHSQ